MVKCDKSSESSESSESSGSRESSESSESSKTSASVGRLSSYLFLLDQGHESSRCPALGSCRGRTLTDKGGFLTP